MRVSRGRQEWVDAHRGLEKFRNVELWIRRAAARFDLSQRSEKLMGPSGSEMPVLATRSKERQWARARLQC